MESDFDSQTADGTERDDRTRARVRGLLGVRFLPTARWYIDLRLRTGSHDNQQSSHLTIHDFDGNPNGPVEVLPDVWAIGFRDKRFWSWAGRNRFPFWKQNGMFWDDDVSLLGAAAGGEIGAGFSVAGGYFTVPDGAVDFLGEMAALQGVFKGEAAGAQWTVAGSAFRFQGEAGAQKLRNGNGDRDYHLWVASAQAKWTVAERPLSVGLDLLTNSKGYRRDDPDPFTAANHDETDGFVIQAFYGGLEERGDWLAGYRYAYVEALAVHASYAQDDWIRWGGGNQTDSSDLKGHELRFAYAILPGLNINTRLFLVDAITSVQDGKRLRIDLNWKL
jgi:hypothetical protein